MKELWNLTNYQLLITFLAFGTPSKIGDPGCVVIFLYFRHFPQFSVGLREFAQDLETCNINNSRIFHHDDTDDRRNHNIQNDSKNMAYVWHIIVNCYSAHRYR
jgi:hypothetical protein